MFTIALHCSIAVRRKPVDIDRVSRSAQFKMKPSYRPQDPPGHPRLRDYVPVPAPEIHPFNKPLKNRLLSRNGVPIESPIDGNSSKNNFFGEIGVEI
ncbi:hypothetical protein B9Z55_027386 [Caenorhabditis nigoni]|uniref:Uncharacterized protein n=1 Tax=Caenorhabditis nigoni TaxID=1611254 RepID=A0A2G5SGR9_9PELO|nr:hypothetical protein B9Z55_027386 [Caenorhabditis nigoni]